MAFSGIEDAEGGDKDDETEIDTGWAESMEERAEDISEDLADEVVRPQLERSSTSASIIRNKRDKAKHLDKVVEKGGGSSNESLESSDPAVKLKKKKDQINQTRKQEAMKKSSTSSCEETEKQKLVPCLQMITAFY